MPNKPKAEFPNVRSRILLVDDHPIVIEGLRHLINQDPTLTVSADAAGAEQALAAIAQSEPDLVLLDLSLGGQNGLELLNALQIGHPTLPVLVLSIHDESLYAERMIRAGARGYIMKDEATGNLLKAIHHVLSGKIYLSEELTNRMLSHLSLGKRAGSYASVESLSNRELEVFQLIGQGRRTREIAEALHLSIKTIDSYREHIKEKLNLRNATELVLHAIQWVQSAGEN